MCEQTVSPDKPNPESTHATYEQSSASSNPVSELAEPNNTETSVSEQQLPSHVEQLDAALTDSINRIEYSIDTTSKQPEPVAEHSPIQSQHAEITKTSAPEEEVVNIKKEDPGNSDLQAVTADTVYSDTDFAQAVYATSHTLLQIGLTMTNLGVNCAHLDVAVLIGSLLAATVKAGNVFEKNTDMPDAM